MDQPIQIRRASQGEIHAYQQRLHEEEAKAARIEAERDKAWDEEALNAEPELQAWEQAAEQLLEFGEEIFGSVAATHLEFDRLVNRRRKLAERDIRAHNASRLPSTAEKRAAFFLALRQAAPPILLLIMLGIPLALFLGSSSEIPLLAAIAGLVWYVHRRMIANLKEMLTEAGQTPQSAAVQGERHP